MTKNEWRVVYKEKRQKLDLQQIEKYQDLILTQFQKLPLPHLSCVHTYLASLRLREPHTTSLISWLEFRNPTMRVAVPKVSRHANAMFHYLLDESVEMNQNEYGIDEPLHGKTVSPEEFDLIFVPLLCFDKNGYRVGYGKGYYDRFLSMCRPDALFVGISYFEPVDQIDDINAFDIPLHYCITPHRIHSFHA